MFCCLTLNAVRLGFLKNFYVSDFAARALLLRLTELDSIEAEIEMRKLLFLDRLVIEPKVALSVRNLLRSRTESLFDTDVKSIGILPSICEALSKYDLFDYFGIWFISSSFHTYETTGSQLSNIKFGTWRVDCGWNSVLFCSGHPNMLHQLA